MAPPSATEPVGVTDTEVASFQGPTSIDGVMARRSKAPKLPTGVAPVATSEMYKGPQHGKAVAKRWDHHFNEETRTRKPSALKSTAQYLAKPGMISLGGGLPSPEYFPIERIDFKVAKPGHFSEAETVDSGVITSAGKYDIAQGKSVYDLHVALNYGQGTGSAQLLRYITEHTELVHNPPYKDWQCAASAGSTSALDMAFRMFCNRGDCILTEQFTFSTATETGSPMGISAAGVAMDDGGMIPEAFETILSEWDEKARGAPKPHLLYTIPTGSNPTGATLSTERRKEIYRIAQKHDVFIVEDEPYYFLQMEPYNGRDAPDPDPPASHAEFLQSLVPSFLSMDVDGRVMRLDSFSKVISPGSRVGWIVACEQVVERYVRHSEFSTQNPSGISQMLLFKLLDETWGHSGYLDWLMFLRIEYTRRRNIMLAACEDHLPLDIASWKAPMAGMFYWIQIKWDRHPQKGAKSYAELEEQIFQRAIANRVLLVKGSLFLADGVENIRPDQDMFFRANYASADQPSITEAIRRFGQTLREEFGLLESTNGAGGA